MKISVTAMDKGSEEFAYLMQKLSQTKLGQGERRNFRLSTHYTTFRRTKLKYKINFYRKKSLEGI
jgi:hypothetical protein